MGWNYLQFVRQIHLFDFVTLSKRTEINIKIHKNTNFNTQEKPSYFQPTPQPLTRGVCLMFFSLLFFPKV
jgi:hypothetical protein